MNEPTKEQLEECELEELQKETDEINKESIQWRDEAIANLNQEIKTLKEQLAEAVELLRYVQQPKNTEEWVDCGKEVDSFLEKQDKDKQG